MAYTGPTDEASLRRMFERAQGDPGFNIGTPFRDQPMTRTMNFNDPSGHYTVENGLVTQSGNPNYPVGSQYGGGQRPTVQIGNPFWSGVPGRNVTPMPFDPRQRPTPLGPGTPPVAQPGGWGAAQAGTPFTEEPGGLPGQGQPGFINMLQALLRKSGQRDGR